MDKTLSDIKIRECTLADVPELVSLGKKTFVDTFGAVNTKEDMDLYVAATFNDEHIRKEVQAPGAKFFLAVDEGRSVGFCKIKASRPPEDIRNFQALEIERIYALKDQIGRGVGKRLMEHCIGYALEHGFEMIWLGVWEHNHPAIRFYEKWGFSVFGQHEFILGHDRQTDLLMKKHLK